MNIKVLANKSLLYVSISVIVMGLSGCVKNIESTIKDSLSGFQSSKYQPITNDSESYNKYLELISKVNGEAVSDTKGEYYHKTKNDFLYRVSLNKNDSSSLRENLKNGKGLLVPYFKYTSNKNGPLIVVDWNKTKQLHSFFVNKMNLKLLPFTDTKKFYKNLKTLSDTYGYTEYNIKSDNNILRESKLAPNYLISNAGLESFYNNNRLFDRNFNANDKLSWYYMFKDIITKPNNINFKPINLITNSSTGNTYYYSSCYSMNNTLFKKALNINKKSNLSSIKKLYFNASSLYDKNFTSFITECKNGYSKLKITGSLSNDKL